MIRTTPFHERTSALNETGLWSHWAGTLAAEKYQLSEKFEYEELPPAQLKGKGKPFRVFNILGRAAAVQVPASVG